MVNIGAGWHTLIAIMLIAGGAGLYFLRSFRPALARDHDIFFAAVGLLCGGILFFQGWRLDPILQFGQFMLTGSVLFFAFESIRLRGIATEQAKRDLPIVDEDRPVSRVYRAELDELEFEERPNSRIRGRREDRSGYADDDEVDTPRRRPDRGSSLSRLESSEDRPRRRPPRPEEQLPPASSRSSSRSNPVGLGEDRPPRRRSQRSEPATFGDDPRYGSEYNAGYREGLQDDVSLTDDEAPRPRRRRSPSDRTPPRSSRDRDQPRDSPDPGDAYVDYQPLPRLEDEENRRDEFDT